MSILAKLFPSAKVEATETVAYLVKRPDGTPVLLTSNVDCADALVGNNPEFTVCQVACRPLGKDLRRQTVYTEA